MRRLVSSIGITLLALLVGGWGSVVAAAFCPHMAANQAQAEDHSCCLAKREGVGANHSSSHHHATHGAKKKQASAASHLHHDSVAGTCEHCVGQNEFPATTASARELTSQKRDAGKMIAQSVMPLALPVAVSLSRFAPTQHAPPKPAFRKHLLLSVFLI